MKKRLTYEAPEAELILVHFEENFLDSGGDNQHSLTGSYNEDGGSGTITNYRDYKDAF